MLRLNSGRRDQQFSDRRPKRPAGARWGKIATTALGIALVIGLYFPGLMERFVLPTPPASTGSRGYELRPSPDPDQAFVAYDPCRPVHYIVRPDNAPPGTDQLVHEAVAKVAAATGLQFENDGLTSESTAEQRKTYLPDLDGNRLALVLIMWSTPEESPGLAGKAAGQGGSAYERTPGHPYVYVKGVVKLDAPALADIMQWPDGPALVRAVIMHELGHVVGLDHVDDPHQLMSAENNRQTEFADGDRAGLALVGSGPCVPQL
jgi:Matrixin